MSIRRALTAGAALLAAAVLSTTPAHATGLTYPVSGGGSSLPGTAPFAASSTSPLTLGPISCSSAAVPTSPTSSITTGPSVVDVVTVNKLSPLSCAFAGGITLTSSGSWRMHGTSAATSANNDVIAVHLHDVAISATNAICRFNATGQVNGTFNEATQTLTINEPASSGNLKASNVAGCLGMITSGAGLAMNVSLVTPSSLYLG